MTSRSLPLSRHLVLEFHCDMFLSSAHRPSAYSLVAPCENESYIQHAIILDAIISLWDVERVCIPITLCRGEDDLSGLPTPPCAIGPWSAKGGKIASENNPLRLQAAERGRWESRSLRLESKASCAS